MIRGKHQEGRRARAEKGQRATRIGIILVGVPLHCACTSQRLPDASQLPDGLELLNLLLAERYAAVTLARPRCAG